MILADNPLTPLEDLLRNILDWLHGTIGLPWAWSIVALTILVRMVLVPLTVRQIHSMQRLQAHAPEMKEIQRKYKHDRQKMSEEMMKFYKENKINPAASCLPIVAQIPVFFSLYFVLNTFSKHPPAGNLEWLGLIHITERASEGWGPLLLVIYVASQTASTLLMSTAMDKTQRMVLLVLPFVFLFVVVNFRSGLVLYWVTTNLWTVGQGIVTRRLVPRGPPAPVKRTSRAPKERRAETARKTEREPEPAEPARAATPAPRRVKRKKRRARR